MEAYLDTIKKLFQSKTTTYVTVAIVIATIAYLAVTGYGILTNSRDSTSITQYNATFEENNSIVTSLPYKTPFYSISYDRHGTDPVTIKIFTESPYYRYQAIQYLTKYDQEVTVNHPIVFVDYTSPLDTGVKQ